MMQYQSAITHASGSLCIMPHNGVQWPAHTVQRHDSTRLSNCCRDDLPKSEWNTLKFKYWNSAFISHAHRSLTQVNLLQICFRYGKKYASVEAQQPSIREERQSSDMHETAGVSVNQNIIINQFLISLLICLIVGCVFVLFLKPYDV